MNLRPYQQELMNKIKQEIFNGKKSICAVLGCGGG
jgi:superfamily II DNA or RNA helicase